LKKRNTFLHYTTSINSPFRTMKDVGLRMALTIHSNLVWKIRSY